MQGRAREVGSAGSAEAKSPGGARGRPSVPSWPRLALVLLLLALPTSGAQQPAEEAPEWPDGAYNWFGHSPIRVFLDTSNLTSESAGFAQMARQAFEYWERGGNGRLQWDARFVEVDDRSDADIVLWFRDEERAGPLCLEDERALGCARPFARPVPIEILARRKGGDLISYQLAREVTQHEIGHAIGFPHSNLRGDIMAPHASSRAGATYAPGDWREMLTGAAVLLAIIAAGIWALLRMMRPVPYVEPLVGAPDAPCPRRRGKPHAFEPMQVNVQGQLRPFRVCRACGGGYPEA